MPVIEVDGARFRSIDGAGGLVYEARDLSY